MSWRRFRYGVILKRVGEERTTVIEPAEAAGELRLESREIIRPHLIDGDEDHELWRRGIGHLCAGGDCPERQSGRNSDVPETTVHLDPRPRRVWITCTAPAPRREARTQW